MKKLLIGVALLGLAAPGVAAAQSGYAGLSYSTNDDTDLDTTALSGAAAIGSNFQLDAGYASVDGGSDTLDTWNIGGHLFARSGNFLWGGYVGYNSFDAGSSLDEWNAAGEMQYYADRTTFSATLGYTQSEFFVDIDQWSLDGEVRHFVTDNFSIQGNLGFASAEADSSSTDLDSTTYGVGAEWQFASAPISIYGGWQTYDFDGSDSSSLGIGARWNWGGTTLLERNRSGASLGRPRGFLERLLVGDATPR